ncbi:phage tail tape measure protein [Devosia nitrariae]|uniref:Uncharacterized protein n=1 Tax=Devosia nitrariae TaxID=2071872 RepID=A0ABQ5W103_9HYPH|nr:phage tail tape measure protein [Devosia nitrariae]GLQ53595.1 hypothetical protein GCM10010862_08540 [Devosia nitrariae]
MLNKLGQFIAEFRATGLKEIRSQVREFVRDATDSVRQFDIAGSVGDGIDTVVTKTRAAGSAIRKTFKDLGGWKALGNDVRWAAARIRDVGKGVVTFFRSANGAVTRFRGHIVTSVRAINAALRSVGTRALTGLISGFRAARTAATGLVGAVRRVVGVLSLITGIGGITSLIASFGALTRAVNRSHDAIQDLQTMSNTLDMPVDELSGFAGFAAQFGVNMDDIRQAFTQFYGVAGQAKSGTGAAYQIFKSIGLDMTDAANRGKPMIALLKDFSDRVARLRGSDRTAVLSQIFGDDDATKVATLLDALSKTDAAGYAKSVEAMKRSGSLVTAEDVRASNRYRAAIETLKDALEGLRLTIFRAFGRPFTFLILKAAAAITRYRHQIVDGLGRAWNTAIYFISDFMRIVLRLDTLLGMKIGYLPERFSWLHSLRDALGVIEETVRATATFIGKYAPVVQKALARTFTPANIRRAIDAVRAHVLDFVAVVQMRDHDLTTDAGKRLAEWRDVVIDGVTGAIDLVRGTVANIASAVGAVIDYLTWSWAQLLAGFEAGDLTHATGTWYSLGFAIQHVSEWISEFIEQLYNVFALGQQATGSFAWINDVVSAVQAVITHFQVAIGWFRGAYDLINSFFQLFGQDLGSALAFVALLKLSGIFGGLGLVLGGFRKLWGFFFGKEAPALVKKLTGFMGTSFKGLFTGLLGVVSNFVAGFGQGLVGGLLTHFGTIGAAVTGLGTLLMRVFGPLGLLAGVATLTYQLLDSQQAWLDPLIEKITGVEAGIQRAVESANASLDRYGRKPGLPASSTAQAIQQAAAPAYTSSGLNYITAGSGMRTRDVVDVNLNIPGSKQPVRLFGERSEIDQLKRNSSLSLAGA